MSGAFTDADYERLVRERDEAFARIDSQRSQIAFYRAACTARFLPEGFGDETMRELIKELTEERDEARAQVDELRGQYQYSVGLSMALEEREKAIRERDLALGRLENEIKAANQARMAEERARESLDELDEAIYECLPSGYDDDSPLDCVEHAADRLRDLAQERDEHKAKREEYAAEARSLRERLKDAYRERDEARAERDSAKLTATAATMAHDTIEKMVRFELRVGPEDSLHTAVQRVRYERDEARADVERLRAIDHTRSYGAIEEEIAAAYHRGAEAMREACQQWCRAWENDGEAIADALADLRVEEP